MTIEASEGPEGEEDLELKAEYAAKGGSSQHMGGGCPPVLHGSSEMAQARNQATGPKNQEGHETVPGSLFIEPQNLGHTSDIRMKVEGCRMWKWFGKEKSSLQLNT